MTFRSLQLIWTANKLPKGPGRWAENWEFPKAVRKGCKRSTEAKTPTPNPAIPNTHHVYAILFLKTSREFCLLSYDRSQEPSRDCSEQLAQMNSHELFILGGLFRLNFNLPVFWAKGAKGCVDWVLAGVGPLQTRFRMVQKHSWETSASLVQKTFCTLS